MLKQRVPLPCYDQAAVLDVVDGFGVIAERGSVAVCEPPAAFPFGHPCTVGVLLGPTGVSWCAG